MKVEDVIAEALTSYKVHAIEWVMVGADEVARDILSALAGAGYVVLDKEDLERMYVTHRRDCPVSSLIVRPDETCNCGADRVVAKLRGDR